ncbi:MAG: hypothetical protein KAU48_10225, partial [Candidatus Thorarchaeota archaeon]|nr:hypothetical protein [Candidatus Thorarchaeota archaeon]
MSKKTGKRTQKSKKSGSKTKKSVPSKIPVWNDAMIQVILNNAHDGIVILGDDYKIEYVNEGIERIYE